MTISVSKTNYGVVEGPTNLSITKLGYGVVEGPTNLSITKLGYGVVIDTGVVLGRRRQLING